MRIIPISQQATGAFNGGQIIENKPIGFPQDGGFVRPYSSLFYWARAEGVVESTIGLHPHKGFEIMSFVIDGRISHFDTKANSWKTLETGDAQIIRAGNGISHAERLEKGAVIFQIWVDPDLSKTLEKDASYSDYRNDEFPSENDNGTFISYYAGERGIMQLDTPGIDIRRIKLTNTPYTWKDRPDGILSIYIVAGSGNINGKSVDTDDYLILEEGDNLQLNADVGGMDVFAFTVPTEPGYATYSKKFAHA
jgi:redox-sensitive bicupin YhaK (pirin superfamily)